MRCAEGGRGVGKETLALSSIREKTSAGATGQQWRLRAGLGEAPAPPAPGAPPRQTADPKDMCSHVGSCEASFSSGPHLHTGHTQGDKKGLSVERGNRSFKNDTGLLSCYILLQLLLGEVSEWRKIRIILTEINAFMENREP